MDLSKETNVEKLKALAFDQIVAKETAEANIRMLNQKIIELEQNKDGIKKKSNTDNTN